MTKLGWKANLRAAISIVATVTMSSAVYAEHLTTPTIVPAAQPQVLPAAGCVTQQPVAAVASTDNCAQQDPPASGVAPIDREQPAAKPFGLKATLYITTNRDSGRDSIGCHVVPMRTVAVDGRIVKRHSVLFIKETVGLRMPDGSLHDGYWYATDVGSAIRPGRIDLYTGKGIATIKPLLHLNLRTLTVTHVGKFAGCPKPDGAPVMLASS